MKAREWIDNEFERISQSPAAYADLMGRKGSAKEFTDTLPVDQQVLIGSLATLFIPMEDLPPEVQRELKQKIVQTFMEYFPPETLGNLIRYISILMKEDGCLDAPQG